MGAKLEYNLIQQTPMIHFQHNEDGACIRASELKPKLDEFIKKKHITEGSIPENWYLCEKKKGIRNNEALNYKVRIKALGEPEKSETIATAINTYNSVGKLVIPPKGNREERDKYNKKVKEIKNDEKNKHLQINEMYFGNMVPNSERNYRYLVKRTYKETVFYKKGIQLEIICLIKELREYIDKIIGEFFIVNNFGTRQNKGFGGFSLTRREDAIELLNQGGYNYFYFEGKEDNYSENMKIASIIYAMMKGGINEKDIYIKGYIQRQYLDDIALKNTGSEKAKIKAEIIPRKPRPKERKDAYKDYKYVRALLGVGDHIEFKDKDKLREDTINIVSSEIERFKSPVTIKIIGKYIFFIWNDSYKLILGKEFNLTAEKEKKNDNIFVPSDFSPEKFIAGFIKYYENKKKSLLSNKKYNVAANLKLAKGGLIE